MHCALKITTLSLDKLLEYYQKVKYNLTFTLKITINNTNPVTKSLRKKNRTIDYYYSNILEYDNSQLYLQKKKKR